MRPEVEFLLEVLDDVVAAQPDEHPLRRVDRDNSRIYDGGGTLDMTTPITKRSDKLEKGNYVGIQSASRDSEPLGQNYNLKGDIVCGLRLEGLRGTGGLYGHVDPDGNDGVPFDDLFHQVRGAILDERMFPDHPAFRDHKLDLQVMNESFDSSGWRDYYRTDADIVLRFREDV